jgi:hypothetical protein
MAAKSGENQQFLGVFFLATVKAPSSRSGNSMLDVQQGKVLKIQQLHWEHWFITDE